MTELEVASEWLRELRLLGGYAEIRPGRTGGGRLAIRPVELFSRLPPEMLATMRTHRSEIKALIVDPWLLRRQP